MLMLIFQEIGDRRQETGGRRQEAGGRRQEAGGRRQEYPPSLLRWRMLTWSRVQIEIFHPIVSIPPI
jgi:hypothetical protein